MGLRDGSLEQFSSHYDKLKQSDKSDFLYRVDDTVNILQAQTTQKRISKRDEFHDTFLFYATVDKD